MNKIYTSISLNASIQFGQPSVFVVLNNNQGNRISFYCKEVNENSIAFHNRLIEKVKENTDPDSDCFKLGIPSNWEFEIYSDDENITLIIKDEMFITSQYMCFNKQSIFQLINFFNQ